jgi:hypothetical protein
MRIARHRASSPPPRSEQQRAPRSSQPSRRGSSPAAHPRGDSRLGSRISTAMLQYGQCAQSESRRAREQRHRAGRLPSHATQQRARCEVWAPPHGSWHKTAAWSGVVRRSLRCCGCCSQDAAPKADSVAETSRSMPSWAFEGGAWWITWHRSPPGPESAHVEPDISRFGYAVLHLAVSYERKSSRPRLFPLPHTSAQRRFRQGCRAGKEGYASLRLARSLTSAALRPRGATFDPSSWP